MTKPASDDAPPSGFFSVGGGRRGAHIRQEPETRVGSLIPALPATRPVKEPKTARERNKAKGSSRKTLPSRGVGPTPQREARGDIQPPRTRDGCHVCVSPVERLFQQHQLSENGREGVKENFALFQAAQRLKRHYELKNAIGIKAQDLNRASGRGGDGDLTQEEVWLENNRHFETAKKLMGWTAAHPNKGPACIVIAVVCEEMTVTEAADLYLVGGRKERMLAAAMDRLRVGLFMLAVHWREI